MIRDARVRSICLQQECRNSSAFWCGGLVGIQALGWAFTMSPSLLPVAGTVPPAPRSYVPKGLFAVAGSAVL